jgi:hypothetical protein
MKRKVISIALGVDCLKPGRNFAFMKDHANNVGWKQATCQE